MISDIVLLKELPKLIKESIEAYIGCLSGAVMKDEYLEKIKAVGFEDVQVIDETILPVEFIANDPTLNKMIKNLGVVAEKIKEVSSSVVSIKVKGIKPDGTS